jgi:hypothetical protein
MANTIRLYYYINSVVSVSIIIISIIFIKETITEYYDAKRKGNQEDIKDCVVYFIWKFSVFFNIFFLFASIGFIGYLLFKRNSHYDRVIFIRVGPTLDTVILIFLIVITLVFGPLMMVELIMMIKYYKDIVNSCKLINCSNSNTQSYLLVPYFIVCFVLSVSMSLLLSLLCCRRFSRRRIIRRRNISFIGELINTI